MSRLAFKIAGLSAKILLLPFRALSRLGLNLLRKLPGFSRATVTGTQGARLANTARNVVGGGARVTTSGGRVVQGGARVTGAVAQTGAKVGLGRVLAGSLPIVGEIVDTIAGIERLAAGDKRSAGLFFASAGASFIPGKGTAISGALTVGGIASRMEFEANKDPKIEPLAEGAAEGKTTLSPESIQPTAKSSMTDLGPLQEMPPEAVLIPQQSQTRDSSRPDSSIGFDTPRIPSSNTDNFYTMYSKLVYNVVD